MAPESLPLFTYAVPDATATVNITRAGQVAWYKFTLATDADITTGRFLDIATAPTGSPSAFAGDATEIALYRTDGMRVSDDDDDAVSGYSQLSFSQALPPLPLRGPLEQQGFVTGPFANGEDGPLQEGNYYIAVTGSGRNLQQQLTG